MADMSLDAYISKKANKGGQSIRGRLGGKRGGRGGGVVSQTKFNVVGLGAFDARQKIAGSARGRGNIADARQKIQNKGTHMVDARQKISKPMDARSKIKNRKGNAVTDARQKIQKTVTSGIKANIGRQQNPAKTATQVTVTGVGRMLSPVGQSGVISGPGGHLMKTIKPDQNSSSAIGVQVYNAFDEDNEYEATQAGSSYSTGANWKITVKNNAAQARHPQPRPDPYMAPVKKTPYVPVVMFDDEEDMMTPPPVPPQSLSTSGPLRSNFLQHNPSTIPEPKLQRGYTRQEPDCTDPVPAADIVSPPQGFRVLITNLHEVVSQDDIIELFGSIGDLKRARLITRGTAEVVYRRRPDAVNAVRKYHMRELDGQPMHAVLSTLGSKPQAATSNRPTSSSSTTMQQPGSSQHTSGPLKLFKSKPGSPANHDSPAVDSDLIHRALFKTGGAKQENRGSVSFTVKI